MKIQSLKHYFFGLISLLYFNIAIAETTPQMKIINLGVPAQVEVNTDAGLWDITCGNATSAWVKGTEILDIYKCVSSPAQAKKLFEIIVQPQDSEAVICNTVVPKKWQSTSYSYTYTIPKVENIPKKVTSNKPLTECTLVEGIKTNSNDNNLNIP